MAVRTSNRIRVNILRTHLFSFGNIEDFELIVGQQESHSFEPLNDGVPAVTSAQKMAVAITFYQNMMGGNAVGGDTLIGGITYSTVASISYDSETDMFTIIIDASSVVIPSENDSQDFYFTLSVIQDDP